MDFIKYLILSFIIIIISYFLFRITRKITSQAVKPGSFAGLATALMVLLSIFRTDPPKNDKQTTWALRSKDKEKK